jgi:hypothetical protein
MESVNELVKEISRGSMNGEGGKVWLNKYEREILNRDKVNDRVMK